MKKLLVLLFIAFSTITYSQEKEWDEIYLCDSITEGGKQVHKGTTEIAVSYSSREDVRIGIIQINYPNGAFDYWLC